MSDFRKNTLISDADENNFISLQAKLNNVYLKKARGAYKRSRAKWMEEGGKNKCHYLRRSDIVKSIEDWSKCCRL